VENHIILFLIATNVEKIFDSGNIIYLIHVFMNISNFNARSVLKQNNFFKELTDLI